MAKKKRAKAAAAITILAWEDDPDSGTPPIPRPVPKLDTKPLAFRIRSTAPSPQQYQPGTADFRYWTAAEALRRCGDFWAPLLGVAQWEPGSTLPVDLDDGDDLNAFYDRQRLAFFHHDSAGQVVFSGESPDVVCHETGHACLDALRPQLFDAFFVEAGAFHESFGDTSAILSALQLDTVATGALATIKSDKPSSLSRLAEQLGSAIRHESPDASEADCLRNASNKFKYVDPQTLPDQLPAKQLSAEFHSFSRVFTGAFYDILSGMLSIRAGNPKVSDLQEAATDYARLLIAGISTAPVLPNYYAQVAAHMIDADTADFGGKYRSVLTDVFAERGILEKSAVGSMKNLKGTLKSTALALAKHNVSIAPTLVTHKIELDGKEFHVPGKIVMNAPVEQKPFLLAATAATHQAASSTHQVEMATHRFVKLLFAHQRVATPGGSQATMAAAKKEGRIGKIKTHKLVKTPGGYELKRQLFLCGCSDG